MVGTCLQVGVPVSSWTWMSSQLSTVEETVHRVT